MDFIFNAPGYEPKGCGAADSDSTTKVGYAIFITIYKKPKLTAR
jgi:hypothetical protein